MRIFQEQHTTALIPIENKLGYLCVAAHRPAQVRLDPVTPCFFTFDFLRQFIEQAAGSTGSAAKTKLIEQCKMTLGDFQHATFHRIVRNHRYAFVLQVEGGIQFVIGCCTYGDGFQLQPFLRTGQCRQKRFAVDYTLAF